MPHRPFVKTLRAQWLGQQLRELREQRGMTLKLVSEHLGRDLSALGRYERAEWPIPRGDVVALLDLYGFHGARERANLLCLAEEVWRAHRWDNDPNDMVNTSFIDFPWLASRAEKICCYDSTVVPVLFQTRDYATQVVRCVESPAVSPDRIARLVDQQAERQVVLGEPGGARVAAIIDESALRRRIGDAALMRAQLLHLDQVRRRPHVEVRVLPVGIGSHPGLAGSFMLFRMRRPYPAVGYLENLAGRLYVEAPISTRFAEVYDRLHESALDARQSGKLIAGLIENG
jgi:hypothetical protein